MFYDFFYNCKVTKMGQWLISLQIQSIVNIIFKHIDSKFVNKILDIGFGRGPYFKELKKRTYSVEYFAIEPNEKLRDAALKMGCNVCVEYKVPPLPVEITNKKYDVIILSHVIEHLKNYSNVVLLFNELKKVLNIDGLIFVSAPDINDYRCDFYNVDYSHEYPTSLRRINKLVEDCGYKIEESGYIRGPIVGSLSSLLFPVQKLIDLVIGSLWNITGMEKLFKVKITFKRNFYMILKRGN